MKTLQIETALNGFIVREASSHRDFMAVSEPHVFETFEALIAHLKQELTPPERPRTGISLDL